MSSAKVAISLDPDALKQVDELVERSVFPSRSKLIQDAVAEKLLRLRRVRLAKECAKLQPASERAAAEEFFQGETDWPDYWKVKISQIRTLSTERLGSRLGRLSPEELALVVDGLNEIFGD